MKLIAFFLLSVFSLNSTEYLSPVLFARRAKPMQESPFFLVMCVSAPHFNYEDGLKFITSWKKHPQGARKDGTVGHAWILLQGNLNGKFIRIEGGQSGERGLNGLTYMERVDALLRQGDPNPARTLFEPLNDGYFEKGPGTHSPTFAAKVELTKEQFITILRYIHPKHYPYSTYSLTGQQCASFVAEIAALAGLNIQSLVTLSLPQDFFIGGERVVLFEDPKFSKISFPSPDMIEQELIRLVQEGRAECALDWYYMMKCK